MAGFSDVPVVGGRLCFETTRIVTEAGTITLICTEENNHPGKHYDTMFSMEW